MPDPLGRVAFCVHVLVGVILVGVIGLSGALGPTDLWGVDAWSYWSYDPVHPYAIGVWGTHGAYQYAPPFAQLFMPGQGLPWHAFLAAWTVLLTAVAVWLAGRIGALATLLPPVTRDIWYGNIHLLMARPSCWASGGHGPGVHLLTKVTPASGSSGSSVAATGAPSASRWAPRSQSASSPGAGAMDVAEWVAVLLDLAGRPAPQVAVVGLGPLWVRSRSPGSWRSWPGLAACAGHWWSLWCLRSLHLVPLAVDAARHDPAGAARSTRTPADHRLASPSAGSGAGWSVPVAPSGRSDGRRPSGATADRGRLDGPWARCVARRWGHRIGPEAGQPMYQAPLTLMTAPLTKLA